VRPRLFLITPREDLSDRLTGLVAAALSGGDVASLLIDIEAISAGNRQTIVKSLVQICHEADVAALIRNDTQLTGRCGADGVHVDSGLADLDSIVDTFRPGKIVGAGQVTNRHNALLVGDMDVDYVFFGPLDRPEDESADPTSIALAEWWSPMIEIPCIAMAGNSDMSVAQACETGAEFVGLRAYAWNDPAGPADAIRKANEILDGFADDSADE